MTTKENKIPEFKSVDEELEFWARHSALDFIDESSVVDIDASKAREKRDKRLTQQISLRVQRRILERTKLRAKSLGVPYQTLIQLWIAERLEQEEAGVVSRSAGSGKRTASSVRQDQNAV